MFTNLLNGDDHCGDDEPGLRSALTLFDELEELESPRSSAASNSYSRVNHVDVNSEDPSGNLRKRSLTGDDGESSDYSSSNGTATKAKKQRKPAHVVFKEARDRLQDELRHLNARAALLRHGRGLADPDVLRGKKALTGQLSDALLSHDLNIATVSSAFSGLFHSRARNPLETFIHLGVDRNQRRNALLAIKDTKVDAAQHFLAERFRSIHPFKASHETSRFESEEGDYCTVKMDVTLFHGASSVHEVLEAIRFASCENERVIVDNSVAQLHSVTPHASTGVQVEKNAVVFYDHSKLNDRRLDKQSAVIATDSVDRDDLHPYRTTQYLRQDESAALKLSAHWRQRHHQQSGDSDTVEGGGSSEVAKKELIVILTRWSFVRLRRPEFDIPSHELEEIASEMSSGIDRLISSVKQAFVRGDWRTGGPRR